MAIVKVEAFLDLEKAIANKVMREFRKGNNRLIREAALAIDQGDYAKAELTIREVDVGPALERSEKTFRLLGTAAMLFGATRVSESPDKSKIAGQDQSELLLDQAVGASMRMTAKLIEQSLLEVLERLIREKERRTEKKAARKVRPFVSFAQDGFINTAKGSAQLASSLHTSRLSVYGYTVEANALNITTYQVSEVLDRRTCPVCETMNGKTFQTEWASQSIQSILAIDDPDTLRSVQPWPRQDPESVKALSQMSNKELVESNWHIPPYHPLCRGILDKTTEKVPDITTTPTLQRPPPKPKPPKPKPVPYSQKDVSQMKDLVGDLYLDRRVDRLYAQHSDIVAGAKITKDEIAAVNTYTTDGASIINRRLAQGALLGDEVADEVTSYDRVLGAALEKLRTDKNLNYKGEVTRTMKANQFVEGLDKAIEKLKPGSKYTTPVYMSTSNGKIFNEAVHSGVTPGITYKIKSKSGVSVKPFSEFPGEDEVLLPRGTEFLIEDVIPNGEKNWVVVMSEV